MPEQVRHPRLKIQQATAGRINLDQRSNISGQQPAQPAPKPEDKSTPSPEEMYSYWQQDPTLERGGQLLKVLEPHIAASARKYAKSDNPVLMGRAKSLVIDALPRYDPKRGTSLSTFLDRQLQPLQRWQARKTIGVRVPTRDVLLRSYIEKASLEMEDELGRAPSLQEVADKTGTPLAEIARLNRQRYPQIAEREMASTDGTKAVVGDQAVEENDRDLWQRAVYHDLSPTDQFIMQHTWGVYGAKQLSTASIAQKLKITPGAVSQRRAKIDAYLQATE